ncbi:MAG: glycine betaine/proline transport system ATP-binding protein, partial [Desulfomicrobiaceae bacterium]|nr:glycine betaine/proline transport system ATP-binding protein [Desulfomicrobiaceae bacterium]
DTTLADLLQRITAEGSPVVIVDGRQRAIGVVDKSSLLAALAQAGSDGSDFGTTSTPETQTQPEGALRDVE